jgi:hypothetical protein
MRPQTYTVSATAGGSTYSPIFIPDRHITPFNIGFGAVVATTAKFSVQHTFVDPLVASAGALTWLAHEYVADSSASIDGNYAFPVAGIRVVVSAANEGGVSVTFVQAGLI